MSSREFLTAEEEYAALKRAFLQARRTAPACRVTQRASEILNVSVDKLWEMIDHCSRALRERDRAWREISS